MKVLKKENTNIWGTVQVCTGYGNGDNGCGALLLVREEDVFVTFLDDIRGPETKFFYTFKCPICGRLTDIPENEIPAKIKELVMKRFGNR